MPSSIFSLPFEQRLEAHERQAKQPYQWQSPLMQAWASGNLGSYNGGAIGNYPGSQGEGDGATGGFGLLSQLFGNWGKKGKKEQEVPHSVVDYALPSGGQSVAVIPNGVSELARLYGGR